MGMKKTDLVLLLGWSGLFVSPLLMDWALNEQHAELTFSEKIREAEASIPHGKTWGQAVLTALFGVLTYHFHWQNQVRGQCW